jgi:hypothetical protein
VDRDGIKICLLISAVSNILVGLLWASTCFGIVFTVPMILLCVFEFVAWSRVDEQSNWEVSSSTHTLGIFEIIVGLANTAALICGIINLMNSGKLK